MCAHPTTEGQPVAQSAAPVPQPPLARSSIGAVLAHRGELNLTDEQIQKLEEMDHQVQVANEAIRTEGNPTRRPPAEPRQQGSPGENRTASDPGSRSATGGPGRIGGGPGMGRGGGHRRGAMRAPAPEAIKHPEAQERMDENDTKAYLDAEVLLSESQRPRAREIAEEYREQLYDWRAAMRAKKTSSDVAGRP